ncbi:TonB system transport protein ExbD [Jiella sp. MQZ9-1]|uniref:Biopolymer transport protein ExbD n=1 Tax=Jiella flava TaxID=2816857 RepID=A0A939JUP0_9HYPH|nr:TonB system transport protein ExbD [Jiella flava]MBO0661609.1 TonB system transport protein ExbD [Jiella flava]MCD2470251.1 TonB system transport protein ExbD [Jiella flava]
MAVKLSAGDDEADEVAEINVTPFIDVMLVLLIIFMVAAPLSTVDVPVDLPTSNAAPQERPDEPVYLTIQKDLTLSLGEQPIGREELAAGLDAATKTNHDERIFVRADGSVPYTDVMAVMNALRRAGYLKIGLVGLEDPAAVTAAPGK